MQVTLSTPKEEPSQPSKMQTYLIRYYSSCALRFEN